MDLRAVTSSGVDNDLSAKMLRYSQVALNDLSAKALRYSRVALKDVSAKKLRYSQAALNDLSAKTLRYSRVALNDLSAKTLRYSRGASNDLLDVKFCLCVNHVSCFLCMCLIFVVWCNESVGRQQEAGGVR